MNPAPADPAPAKPAGRPPMHPYWVLLVAGILPGVGQVLNGTARRGMIMVGFMIMLGWVTANTTTPEHSFLGRYAGGLFVYAISLMDAYRWARYRWEAQRQTKASRGG